MTDVTRCGWAGEPGSLMCMYHDEEWGVPVRDDRRLFELLCLEGAQAGLSWQSVLSRREGYRAVYRGFDVEWMAALEESQLAEMLQDKRIIRNRAKVKAFVLNAQAALPLMRQAGGFSGYLWSFVDDEPAVNRPQAMIDIPPETEISLAMSKDLKRKGFGFVGPTICYAFMQSAGMVNDHITTCFRHSQVNEA